MNNCPWPYVLVIDGFLFLFALSPLAELVGQSRQRLHAVPIFCNFVVREHRCVQYVTDPWRLLNMYDCGFVSKPPVILSGIM